MTTRPRIGLRGTALAVALLTTLATAGQACAGPRTAPEIRAQIVPATRAEAGPLVPPRVSPGHRAPSDVELFRRAARAMPGGAGAQAPAFVVGLKRPGAQRGVWRERVLIGQSERTAAERHVDSLDGVQVVGRDERLPVVTVRIRDLAALSRVRRLPSVDYVDPLYLGVRTAAPGCVSPVLDTTASGHDSAGDVLPWSFMDHRIVEAWRRLPQGPGAGVRVAVIDTGVARDQSQLSMPEFAAGQSSGRSVVNLGSLVRSNDTPWGQCNHGTRMAGLIAAPRDGRNVVGIAWKADLTTVHTHDSVVIGSDNASDIVRGIRKAVVLPRPAQRARIVTLAFGNPVVTGDMHLIEDEIRSIYYGSDTPGGVLFLGAAGTTFCAFGIAWPSYIPEVVTVAGVARDRHTPWNESCSGDAVDTAAVIGDGDVETTGLSSDEVVGLGGSSGATATIAGIAALIWSKYPTWNRDQVRQRLFQSGQGYRDSVIGWGVPDAFTAVGGLTSVSIQRSAEVTAGAPYTLQARTGFADGPFTYHWSTGQTTASITRNAPANGAAQTTTLTVTDPSDGTSVSATVHVKPIRDTDPRCLAACPRNPGDAGHPTHQRSQS